MLDLMDVLQEKRVMAGGLLAVATDGCLEALGHLLHLNQLAQHILQANRSEMVSIKCPHPGLNNNF